VKGGRDQFTDYQAGLKSCVRGGSTETRRFHQRAHAVTEAVTALLPPRYPQRRITALFEHPHTLPRRRDRLSDSSARVPISGALADIAAEPAQRIGVLPRQKVRQVTGVIAAGPAGKMSTREGTSAKLPSSLLRL
jgi:hypothetical protein